VLRGRKLSEAYDSTLCLKDCTSYLLRANCRYLAEWSETQSTQPKLSLRYLKVSPSLIRKAEMQLSSDVESQRRADDCGGEM